MMILGLLLIALGLLLAYAAGADTKDRAKWQSDYDAPSRQRHPSSKVDRSILK